MKGSNISVCFSHKLNISEHRVRYASEVDEGKSKNHENKRGVLRSFNVQSGKEEPIGITVDLSKLSGEPMPVAVCIDVTVVCSVQPDEQHPAYEIEKSSKSKWLKIEPHQKQISVIFDKLKVIHRTNKCSKKRQRSKNGNGKFWLKFLPKFTYVEPNSTLCGAGVYCTKPLYSDVINDVSSREFRQPKLRCISTTFGVVYGGQEVIAVFAEVVPKNLEAQLIWTDSNGNVKSRARVSCELPNPSSAVFNLPSPRDYPQDCVNVEVKFLRKGNNDESVGSAAIKLQYRPACENCQNIEQNSIEQPKQLLNKSVSRPLKRKMLDEHCPDQDPQFVSLDTHYGEQNLQSDHAFSDGSDSECYFSENRHEKFINQNNPYRKVFQSPQVSSVPCPETERKKAFYEPATAYFMPEKQVPPVARLSENPSTSNPVQSSKLPPLPNSRICDNPQSQCVTKSDQRNIVKPPRKNVTDNSMELPLEEPMCSESDPSTLMKLLEKELTDYWNGTQLAPIIRGNHSSPYMEVLPEPQDKSNLDVIAPVLQNHGRNTYGCLSKDETGSIKALRKLWT